MSTVTSTQMDMLEEYLKLLIIKYMLQDRVQFGERLIYTHEQITAKQLLPDKIIASILGDELFEKILEIVTAFRHHFYEIIPNGNIDLYLLELIMSVNQQLFNEAKNKQNKL